MVLSSQVSRTPQSSVASPMSFRKQKLLKQGNRFVVRDMLRPVFADKRILGEEGDLGKTRGIVQIPVIGQPHTFVGVRRADVAGPDHAARIALGDLLRNLVVEELF